MMDFGAFPLGRFQFGHKTAQISPASCAPYARADAPCHGMDKADRSSKPSAGNCQNRYPSPLGWSELSPKFRSPFSLNSVRIAPIWSSEVLCTQHKQPQSCDIERKGKKKCKSNLGLLHWDQRPLCRAVSQQIQTLTTRPLAQQSVQPLQSFWTGIRWLAQLPEQVQAHFATTQAFVTKKLTKLNSGLMLPGHSVLCGFSAACSHVRKLTAVFKAPKFANAFLGDATGKGLSLCGIVLYSGLCSRFFHWVRVQHLRLRCLQKRISSQRCWRFLTLTKVRLGGVSAVFKSMPRWDNLIVPRPAFAAVLCERAAFCRLSSSQKWVTHV